MVNVRNGIDERRIIAMVHDKVISLDIQTDSGCLSGVNASICFVDGARRQNRGVGAHPIKHVITS
jgi:hypothetical protein